jgi:hypothetical protein
LTGEEVFLSGRLLTKCDFRAVLNIPRQSEQGFHGKKNTNSTAK